MITQEVHYAITLMNALKDGEEKVLRLSDVSVLTGLKLDFLSQVARKLRLARWIRSHRGPGGGYTLVKRKVNLHEVIEVCDRTGKYRTMPKYLAESVKEALSDIAVV